LILGEKALKITSGNPTRNREKEAKERQKETYEP